MKLYFYRGSRPNFGDELNEWLLPKVFPNFFDDDPSILFLGIGSVLFDTHPASAIKVVFGSGYGGYTPLPTIDSRWHFYCVRGPRTAAAFHLSEKFIAGDAAILAANYRQVRAPKDVVSFMPHWESLARGNWQKVCDAAGLRFIDPSLPVNQVMEMIQDSRLLVAEAMHGAIVADTLRVPWIPIMPSDRRHVKKWYDWAEALDVNLAHLITFPSTFREFFKSRTGRDFGHDLSGGPQIFDTWFLNRAAKGLLKVAQSEPWLSTDSAHQRCLARLEEAVWKIKRDYGADK